MESKVKSENFIVIQGWMINELELKGNDLMIYAIIYGFSQAEGQCYNGGLQYLADWTKSTKQGVMKNLKSLLDKGLIVKEEKFVNNVKFCEYRSTKLNTGSKQSLMGYKTKLNKGGKQSSPNNIPNNIPDNLDALYEN